MNKEGFTLIELLVAVAIVGLLATIVLASLNAGRVNTRDAKRISDIKSLEVAAEAYYAATGSAPGNGATWWAQVNNSCSSLQPDPYTQLQPTYFGQLPDDPLSSGAPSSCSAADGYWYYYGRGYQLVGNTITATGKSTNWVFCSKLESSNSSGYQTIANPWNGSWTLNYCLNSS